jgi:hypothetical protein
VCDSTELGFELEADVDRPHLRKKGIQFVQLLPDGAPGSFSSEDRVLPEASQDLYAPRDSNPEPSD